MPKTFFFYNETRIEVEDAVLTGREIKEAIRREDASVDLTHDLVLEGLGNDADKVIGDLDSLDLSHGHGAGPKRFFLRPPTNFGNDICCIPRL
jgi:hypothetical protein